MSSQQMNVMGNDDGGSSGDEAHFAAMSTSTVRTSVQRKRQRTSKAWETFTFIPGNQFADNISRAQCKNCPKLYVVGKGISNLTRHSFKCIGRAIEVPVSNVGSSKAIDQNRFKELMAMAIIKHGYEFAMIEHGGLQDVMAYLNDDFKSFTRNTAKSHCLKIHKREKEKLKTILSKVPGRLCLTCDLWTSCATEGYLCLTVHYVDFEWRLNTKILNFCHIPPPHSAIVLFLAIYDLLKEWQIEKKIFSITLDNARCNDVMQSLLIDKLKEDDALVCDGEYFHIRCGAHILNLIVNEGLKQIRASIDVIREWVKYVKGSESRMIVFEDCAKRSNCLISKGLWLDCPTRWNSTYMMLERAELYRRAFQHLKLVDRNFDRFSSDVEWEKIKKIKNILKPFDDITNLFSGVHYPTSNLYFCNVWRIQMRLMEASKSMDSDIRNMGLA
ncbi:unnamed protein product [Linum tenue]|uniref:Transposase n=1 Tax=Linum tenue TaxID=586396 RepID=A0AAV0KHI5_9ROSI|nr:unnamed protein product [Linum tenue]